MKKFLALLLALVLCCGLACAYADVLEADDLVGSWYAEDEELIPFVLTLNSDQTFEAVIDADLPIEENHIEGTWEFDGAALTLHCADKDLALTLDGAALVGDLFGVTLEFHSEYMEEILEAIIAGEEVVELPIE